MREYVERLSARSELRIVEREVDPQHELAAVTRRSQAESDLPLLFRRVRGSRFPVVTNLYGSRRRLCELIGAEDGNFPRRWAERVNGSPAAPGRSVRAVDTPGDLRAGRLSELPQITHWERDGGAYVTAGVFLAREPDSGAANLSFHRAMIVGEDELRVRLGSTHDLAGYQRKAEERDQPLPAALLIGTAPELSLVAAASLPYGRDELEVAARLLGKPVELRPCRTLDLSVPADTEVVVEGEILPRVRAPEGPFGEFMGYYVPRAENHVFRVHHVGYRENALFQDLLCGSAEDLRLLEEATAARIYGHLVGQVPGVVRVAVHAALLCTVVGLRQQYPGHARHVALAAAGSHLDYNKAVIVVDDDVDVYDLGDVWWAFLTRGRADTRTTVIPDVPGFYRDPERDHWGRLLLDATKPWGREAEFERRRIPGEEKIRLEDYFGRRRP